MKTEITPSYITHNGKQYVCRDTQVDGMSHSCLLVSEALAREVDPKGDGSGFTGEAEQLDESIFGYAPENILLTYTDAQLSAWVKENLL